MSSFAQPRGVVAHADVSITFACAEALRLRSRIQRTTQRRRVDDLDARSSYPLDEIQARGAAMGFITAPSDYTADVDRAVPVMGQVIRFYRQGDAWGEFSNFSGHPIDRDGERWQTTEHYFQARKFADPELQRKVRDAKTPGEAARLGRRLPGLREDWEQVKEDVMLRALRAKFMQHARLARLLLSTQDAQLVEHTNNDQYWADGGDGSGKNRLGELLMQLRAELRAQ